MADRPLSAPLPADLPEDWTSGQIVAPAGADVGLSEQHGYNYLMAQVNAAQRAANTLNEGFDDISGKRTCRFVVGTSTAGWTQADCDYLCDGTDDQVELQAAVDAAPVGGCEIVLLDGTYNLGGVLNINNGVWVHGNGDSTTLVRKTVNGAADIKYIIALGLFSRLTDIAYEGAGATENGCFELINSGAIENVSFSNCGYGCVWMESGNAAGDVVKVSRCRVSGYNEPDNTHVIVRVVMNLTTNAVVSENVVVGVDYLLDTTGHAGQVFRSLVVSENISTGSSIKIDTRNTLYGNFSINNNKLAKIELENSIDDPARQVRGALVFGNIFTRASGAVITLGPGTTKNFIFGNALMSGGDAQLTIVDEGDGNIVFGNSNDTGSGGGGSAGVTSFKGRTGSVTPQNGDYTAAMVGAVPAGAVTAIQSLTQAEYDALTAKNATTLYLIEG